MYAPIPFGIMGIITSNWFEEKLFGPTHEIVEKGSAVAVRKIGSPGQSGVVTDNTGSTGVCLTSKLKTVSISQPKEEVAVMVIWYEPGVFIV